MRSLGKNNQRKKPTNLKNCQVSCWNYFSKDQNFYLNLKYSFEVVARMTLRFVTHRNAWLAFRLNWITVTLLEKASFFKSSKLLIIKYQKFSTQTKVDWCNLLQHFDTIFYFKLFLPCSEANVTTATLSNVFHHNPKIHIPINMYFQMKG